MSKGKNQKTYESGGQEYLRARGQWAFEKPKPIKLRKRDQLRKMIQDCKR